MTNNCWVSSWPCNCCEEKATTAIANSTNTIPSNGNNRDNIKDLFPFLATCNVTELTDDNLLDSLETYYLARKWTVGVYSRNHDYSLLMTLNIRFALLRLSIYQKSHPNEHERIFHVTQIIVNFIEHLRSFVQERNKMVQIFNIMLEVTKLDWIDFDINGAHPIDDRGMNLALKIVAEPLARGDRMIMEAAEGIPKILWLYLCTRMAPKDANWDPLSPLSVNIAKDLLDRIDPSVYEFLRKGLDRLVERIIALNSITCTNVNMLATLVRIISVLRFDEALFALYEYILGVACEKGEIPGKILWSMADCISQYSLERIDWESEPRWVGIVNGICNEMFITSNYKAKYCIGKMINDIILPPETDRDNDKWNRKQQHFSPPPYSLRTKLANTFVLLKKWVERNCANLSPIKLLAANTGGIIPPISETNCESTGGRDDLVDEDELEVKYLAKLNSLFSKTT